MEMKSDDRYPVLCPQDVRQSDTWFAKINANELETLQIPLGPQTVPMQGRQYLTSFVLANMLFHATMAYGLLRQQGVVLGKRDFLVAG